MQEQIISFIRQTFSSANPQKAIIAVSGGIDSAVVLSLLTRALSVEKVLPVLLPFGDQDMSDAKEICTWNGFSQEQWIEINIEQIVKKIAVTLNEDLSSVRLGNIMARTRMIILFDLAKSHEALVVGTENKSENLLGYFTRFGDAASDLEPISHLYKTQVRQLAQELRLPDHFICKPPSAGLWANQTDEQELGFSYELADKVLIEIEERAISQKRKIIELVEEELGKSNNDEIRQIILNRLKHNWFKQLVPFKIT